MNIYLDIDGVLIVHGQPADHALEFLKEITAKHTCYWLTTHCRGGENRAPEYLLRMFPIEAKSILEKIRPTDWRSLKTEAIDFSQDFRWFDDYIFEAEKDLLKKHQCANKFVQIDLISNPNQLRDIAHTL